MNVGSVNSADGTVIGYRWLGSGPAVLLIHGGMQASQHLMKLAVALSADFTVFVPDRRGRGLSGPHGDYSITREVEDLQALIAATGASRVFGLSSGALVTLRTALAGLEAIALYEPPLSVNDSVPLAWVPRFDREIARGRIASALVTSLKGLKIEPWLGRLPRFVLVPLMAVGSRLQGNGSSDDVPISALVPTFHFDIQLVQEMADTAQDYSSLGSRVLLLGGAKSPAFLGVTLDELAATIPHAQRITFTGLGHSGPDDDGDPERVAEALRDFFTT
ncbi:pimeloyl-ACP methyl ester carboxylesterase [Kibdelosporangium banguiense]|uniref:Pimeloyl-ACP methyl ester carboxylesterase n=1 Tax=Kibdelosporangium banguiense TaxID=1365924 RepID=A0ABS4U033_9PSEU|nr:alpha/beta hydrolase [Kibdelosporangium banguiense]MBP2330007.1 pimeloyl-ACP methyl ester carboxylesterase [Kibdelosporangium banguiense]